MRVWLGIAIGLVVVALAVLVFPLVETQRAWKFPVTGKRRFHMETVRGTRKQAETELAKRITELAEGRYVAPTVETVETYATHWIENIAPASRAAVTVKRYETLLRTHIIPSIGHIELQNLDGTAIDRFYASRRGLAPAHVGQCPFAARANPRIRREGKEAHSFATRRHSN
jgi:Phage integrase, N-terminal SAM-like domain